MLFGAVRRPLDFGGRAARSEFWGWIALFLGVEFVALAASTPGALSLWLLFMFVPHASVTVRRLHDINAAAWWAVPHLTLLVLGTIGTDALAVLLRAPEDFEAGLGPLLSRVLMANNFAYITYTVVLAVALAGGGTAGSNRFGTDPKGRVPGSQP